MSILDELVGLISSKLKIVHALFCIAKLETNLMKLSIYPLIVSFIQLFIVLITVWITTMGLVFYGIYFIDHHMLISLGAVLLLNVILCVYLLASVKGNLKLMSFEKTRHYLYPAQETPSHHAPTKTNPSQHHPTGERATAAPTDGTATSS